MTRHMGLIVWGWLITALALLPLFLPGTASAAVSSRTVNEGGKELVVIANDSLELTFEPARGGRCVRFVFRDNGEQIIGGRRGVRHVSRPLGQIPLAERADVAAL